MSVPAVRIAQVAIVVRDLDAAVRAYSQRFGWGPWQILDFRDLPHHQTTHRGAPASFTMRTAVTTVGEITFEIVEPGDGPSHYRDFLEAKGEGLHHILCETTTGAPLSELLASQGVPVAMGGSVGDALDYAYHDVTDLRITVETTTVHPAGDVGVFGVATAYPP